VRGDKISYRPLSTVPVRSASPVHIGPRRPGTWPVSVVLVSDSKAHHGLDKRVARAVLAHVPKAQPKQGMMNFYFGCAGPFNPSCHEQPNEHHGTHCIATPQSHQLWPVLHLRLLLHQPPQLVMHRLSPRRGRRLLQ
jgi:hypothetical protein